MNWKAFRENLRVLLARETNQEAPGSVLLSSMHLQTAVVPHILIPSGPTTCVTARNTHPKRSMKVYFRAEWEPLEGLA